MSKTESVTFNDDDDSIYIAHFPNMYSNADNRRQSENEIGRQLIKAPLAAAIS